MVDSQSSVNPDPRRALPSVGRLSAEVSAARRDLPEWAVTEAARQVVAEARQQLAAAKSPQDVPAPEWQARVGDLAEQGVNVGVERGLGTNHHQCSVVS